MSDGSALPFDKIVIMANEVDRLGGIGRFINQVAKELHAKGFEVEMVGVAPPPEGHFQEMARPEGVTQTVLMPEQPPENWTLRTAAHKADPRRRARYQRRMELRAMAVAKLEELLPAWGPRTLVLCTQVYGMEHMLEAGYDAKNADLPRVIGQYHGSAKEAHHIKDMRRVLRAYGDVDRFVALTPVDAIDFRKAGLNNATWIANPVDVPAHQPQERRKVFMSLGRYDKIKSLDLFIRAWALIAERLPDWSAELYGEGAEREALQQLIDDERIPRVTLMGKTDDVGSTLASTSIHVLSSQNEGLPIAIVEAGHMGVPTVAFDCAPGVRFLIEDGVDGAVVDQDDVVAMSERMLELAGDPGLLARTSEAVRASSQRFIPHQIMDRWLQEFDELRM